MRVSLLAAAVCVLPLLTAVPRASLSAQGAKRPVSVADAERFVARAEREIDSLLLRANRAAWVGETYITDDTETLSAEAQRDLNVAIQRLATEAVRYEKLPLSPVLSRKLLLVKLSLVAPPPADAKKATELATLSANLTGMYGKGTWCRPAAAGAKAECLQLPELERILATSRDPAALRAAWLGWHTISVPMRDKYTRLVQLSNEGARTLGYTDTGELWRSGYDMSANAFAADMDRVWTQLRPLYLSLHTYVRAKLVEKYGATVVPPTGPIPSHLLGNMWAQDWSHIFDIVAPAGVSSPVDVTTLVAAKQVDAIGMVRYGEGFFTSLGFPKLPETFWTRSQFVKPRDREVVCHASAWDVDAGNDLRVKMCIEPTAEFFSTVHHELGHNFYQRAYNTQPVLFRNGANDGFHEAIGDAIALSLTPKYLQQVGLLTALPPASADTLLLLQQALERVSFLPFGLLVDQWRWKVFSGEVTPANYNAAWWELKRTYQGVAPPVARSEADFDPGAKNHIAANIPYAAYFLAHALEFQFYRAMCKAAGHTGPLYRCSFYGSAAAGEKLAAMLKAGQSKPWQETLLAMTGEKALDAGVMLEYFQPLQAWLDRQNQGKPVGW
jgi:peptidyl-dipeptidase A